MSYRVGDHPHRPKHRTVQKANVPMGILVTNGSSMDAAFPCWYADVRPPWKVRPHFEAWHNHVGWPTPNHPDDTCQPHLERGVHFVCGIDNENRHHSLPWKSSIDLARMWPIHLLEEGYEQQHVEILFGDDAPSTIYADGWIDEDDDWIIRLRFHVYDEDAMYEKQEYRFTVRIFHANEREEIDRTDVAFVGRLIVLPALIDTLR